jgi:hypothetical protein
MSDVIMLRGAEPRKILCAVIDRKLPAVMSYLVKGKWHTVKVLPKSLGATKLEVEIPPKKKSHPIDIRIDQPVGMSLKYEYGKFIFETRVVALEPSACSENGGTIGLVMPDRIEIVQRRNYFRVCVPKTLKVNVVLWHRTSAADNKQVLPSHYWQAKLMDISAGGAQIAIDAAEKSDFRKGQFVALRFTPMPYETPLMFNAQIRTILPTADGKNVCMGIQIIGLEASQEGREILQRLCTVVEQYYKMNQTGVKQRDMQAVNA